MPEKKLRADQIIPPGVRKRIEMSMKLQLIDHAWPEAIVVPMAEIYKEWMSNSEVFKCIQDIMETLAPGKHLHEAIMLELIRQKMLEADYAEGYDSCVELLVTFVRQRANLRMGRDVDDEMWVCMPANKLSEILPGSSSGRPLWPPE